MELVRTGDILTLTDGVNSICADFSANMKRIRRANLRGELLVKAVKIKGRDDITVLDATAGLAEDSFLLAAAGMKVLLFEHDKMIAELLADAIRRGLADPNVSDTVSRLELFREDSIEAMKSGCFKPDVVYLDPMFPARTKTALVKKKFQILQQLEAPCDNGAELLDAAFLSGARKIVVKRPLKGEWLGERKPDHSYEGSTIRYDCYMLHDVLAKE